MAAMSGVASEGAGSQYYLTVCLPITSVTPGRFLAVRLRVLAAGFTQIPETLFSETAGFNETQHRQYTQGSTRHELGAGPYIFRIDTLSCRTAPWRLILALRAAALPELAFL